MKSVYRTDGRVRPGIGPPSSAIPKRSTLSTQSVKRKARSMGSTSPNPSLLSSETDKPSAGPQRKKSSPAIIPPERNVRRLAKNTKNNKDDIENKRLEFVAFQKQFIEQQERPDMFRTRMEPFKSETCRAVPDKLDNTYIELYAQLRDLEDRSGMPAGATVGEARLLSVTGWPVHELLLLMPDNAPTQQKPEVKGVLGPKILQQLSTQLKGIPDEVLTLGDELMSRRARLIEFIRKNQKLFVSNSNIQQWQIKNAEFDKETEDLRKRVSETAKTLESKILHGLDIAKIPWIDRDNMVKKIESLQKELSIYKKGKSGDSVNKTPDHNLKLQKALEELNKERSARVALREILGAAESRIAATGTRTRELERQLNSSRADLTAAQRRLDNFKKSNRAPGPENSKRLRQISKNGDVTIEVLSRQRDALELRVKEVEEESANLMQDAESREAQLKSHIEYLNSKVDEEIQNRQSLEAQIQELKKKMRNVQEKYSALQESSRELVALQKQKRLEYLPRKGQCTIEEIEIWNDLQATKAALDRVTEELEHSRADRDSLLKSLASVAHEGGENKIAEELLNREHTIRRLQKNVEELKKDKIKLEQNLTCYENQLTALRFEVNHLRSFNSYRSESEKIPNEELEREIYNLYLQLATLKRERAELASEAATRALLLERHERCADMFAQVTRARHELAAQIAGTTPPSDGPVNQEVLSSLSKAYLSSADNWSALRAERARVLRLESTVNSQRQQLERESLLRVQHEQRRAQLERELIRTWAGNLQRSSDAQVPESLYSDELSKS